MLDIEDLSHIAVSQNIRHELDPTNVVRHREDQIERIERRRIELKAFEQALLDSYLHDSSKAILGGSTVPPPGPGYVDAMADRWIEKELHHFNNAHVVETPTGEKRFYLSYSVSIDDDSNRTGPFVSLQAARLWFFLGGR